MANLPAQQAQYVKYAEKDKKGKEIIGLADVVEMNSARTEMTIGTNLVVDGSISTEDDIACQDITASGDISVGDDLTVTGDASVVGALAVTGDIKPMENIVDNDGNKRFITGDITGEAVLTGSGATIDYAKWSLAGTHLMIVLQIYNPTANTINIANYSGMAYTEGMRDWLLNKIVPIQSGTNSITYKTFKGLNQGLNESTNELGAYLSEGADRLYINSWNNTSLEAGYHYRIQFDLIID